MNITKDTPVDFIKEMMKQLKDQQDQLLRFIQLKNMHTGETRSKFEGEIQTTLTNMREIRDAFSKEDFPYIHESFKHL